MLPEIAEIVPKMPQTGWKNHRFREFRWDTGGTDTHHSYALAHILAQFATVMFLGRAVKSLAMNRILLGLLLGLGAGIVDVLLMLPMNFPDKRTALVGAFSSRFAIGFLAANVNLPFHPALAGLLVGLLISIPDAVITKAYAPVLITGVIFGALCGWAGHAWGA